MKAQNQRVPFMWKAVRKLSLIPIFLAFSITLLHSFVPHTHHQTCKNGFTQHLPHNPWLMWLTLDLGTGHLIQYDNSEQTEEEPISSIYLLRTDIDRISVADIENIASPYYGTAIFAVKIKNPPGNYFSLRAPPTLV